MVGETEPCPFCRARIIPIMEGGVKICPLCGGRWFDFGRGFESRYHPSGAGGAGACIAIRRRRKDEYQYYDTTLEDL